MEYICNCEDYPCCGHSKEERYTTKEEQDNNIKSMVQQALNDEFY